MQIMDAGRLRHRVVIQYPVEVQDQTTGAIDEQWANLATVWAAIEPLSAREFIAAQAEQSKVSARIVIRQRSDVDATMRVFHAASGFYYNIEGVLTDIDSGRDYITLPVSQGVRYENEVNYVFDGEDAVYDGLDRVVD